MSRKHARARDWSRFGPDGSNRITLHYAAFLALAAVTVLSALSAAVVVGYVYFRDEALHALSSRQQNIEQSYEERVNALRRELEKINSIRLVEEAATNARVRELSTRQSELETRSAVLAALAQSAGVAGPDQNVTVAGRAPAPATSANGLRTSSGDAVALPAPALGFAPTGLRPSHEAARALERAAGPEPKAEPRPETRSDTPEPELRPGLRGASLFNAPSEDDGGRGAHHPNVRRVAQIADSVSRIEQLQVEALNSIGMMARREAARLQTAFADIGLKPERLATDAGAVGGPFVPAPVNGRASEFDRKLAAFHDDLRRFDLLRRAIVRTPVGRPVAETAEMSSNFGSRIDPFLGRPAFHTGVDFRDWYGAPVFASAAGSVVSAGSNGGYGLMVEIDHGAGITTRYAHLSALLVQENQTVVAGQRIGRIGSTGRSTGPHLHYEVRIDDAAVDPTRFLRAGARLAQAASAPDCNNCPPQGLP